MHVVVIVLINPSSPSLFVSLKCSKRFFGASLTLGLSGNGWSSVCMADTSLWAQEKPYTAGGACPSQQVWAAQMWKWVPREPRNGTLMVTIGLRILTGMMVVLHCMCGRWGHGGTGWSWCVTCRACEMVNFCLRLSMVQARFLQGYHRHTASVLQLVHFKSRLEKIE